MQITTDNGVTLIFDTSLDETAKAIFEINQGGHPSVESVRDYILASARRWVNKPTITGTGGWYVVALPWESDPPGTLHATCVVMAYSVNAYLKGQAEEPPEPRHRTGPTDMTRDEEPQITCTTIDVYRPATRTSGEGYVPERGYRFTYADGSHSEAFYLTEEQQVIFERQEAKRREDFQARLVTAEVPDTHEDEK